jgi:anti-anti-sigma factor
MSRRKPSPSDPAALRIVGEMTIFRAAELKGPLLALLDDPAQPALDLAGVTEIDTAGLQLLLLVRREAQARGREVRLTGRSAAVVELLELAGVAAHFAQAPAEVALPAAPRRARGPRVAA